jgi:hypothetical protein
MTTIGALLLESIAAEARRCDADAALKLAQTLACLPDRWALSEIPDAPKGPEPTPEQSHIHYTCFPCGWGVDWVGGSGDPEEDQRVADQAEEDIADHEQSADHEQKHREEAAKSPAESWPEGVAVEPYAHIIRRGDHGIGMVYHDPVAPDRVACWECKEPTEVGSAPDLRKGTAILLAHIEVEHAEVTP